MATKSLNTVLKDDSFFVKKLNRIKKMKMKDELWVEELESLQVSRGIRSLNTTALLQSSVHNGIESNIDNQTVRSRCTEIKMKAMKQMVALKEAEKTLRSYITHKYNSRLNKLGSSVTERKQLVDFSLHKISIIIEKLEFVIKLADVVIDDCDAAGYTLHRIGILLDSKAKDR